MVKKEIPESVLFYSVFKHYESVVNSAVTVIYNKVNPT